MLSLQEQPVNTVTSEGMGPLILPSIQSFRNLQYETFAQVPIDIWEKSCQFFFIQFLWKYQHLNSVKSLSGRSPFPAVQCRSTEGIFANFWVNRQCYDPTSMSKLLTYVLSTLGWASAHLSLTALYRVPWIRTQYLSA